MKTHLIIDFMHLVHRAKSVKIYLSTEVDKIRHTDEKDIYEVQLFNKIFTYYGSENGLIDGYRTALHIKSEGAQLRTTTIYMVLKFIESAIKVFKERGEVDVTVCFDSKKNIRKEFNNQYKNNRNNGFCLDDHSDVNMIETILEEMGYNCLKVSGYEADDLVYWANKLYKERYNQTVILTNDMDLVYNIEGNSKLYIFKAQDKKYHIMDEENANDICSTSYGIEMPYSSIMLYKSLVGDTSDHIKGIKGYGKKTFEKMIKEHKNFDFSALLQWENVEKFIKQMGLTGEKEEQALEALSLVRPRDIDLNLITEPRPVNQKKKAEILGILNIKTY